LGTVFPFRLRHPWSNNDILNMLKLQQKDFGNKKSPARKTRPGINAF